MRLYTLVFITLFVSVQLTPAQPLFPVKVDKKWGLINSDGRLVLQPVYDAIGEFKEYGYAVMQRNGGVGLLNRKGKEVIPPNYQDLKVLDSDLVAVMENGEWQVLNMYGKVVVSRGYDRVQVWKGPYLAFLKNKKWGVVTKDGQRICSPQFDAVDFPGGDYFVTWKRGKLGVLANTGKILLDNIAEDYRLYAQRLIFYQQKGKWGAIDLEGNTTLPPDFDSFKQISDSFVKLLQNNRVLVYSIPCGKIITKGNYDDFYAFSRSQLLVKHNRKLGLMGDCGRLILPVEYNEIQHYDQGMYRVNYEGKWGVVHEVGKGILPFEYDYIAPLKGNVCLVKKGEFFGVANVNGEQIVPCIYHRVALEDKQAKAFSKNASEASGESMTLYVFNEKGELVDNNNFAQHFKIKIRSDESAAIESNLIEDESTDYTLDHYEWFYSPESDRWGLRNLEDGSIQIDPTFDVVHVEKELGFTLVGIKSFGRYDFERTTYRFEMIYGLVKNDVGLLVTEVDFWDVRFDDFEKGYSVARCVFSNGRHGIVDNIGRIVRRDFAYIGDFSSGVARMSIKGTLSGKMKAANHMGRLSNYLTNLTSEGYRTDQTQYDRLFELNAVLTCEDCEWGYIDTSGHVVVEPSYSFATDFVNEVGIVACQGKWGLVNRKAETLIPCDYDGLQFLENTDNQIIRVYIQQPKYGLIDTLGNLTVKTLYEEIGSFSEGRLAVKRNGLWGFVNADGLEVIPCRFREVHNFSGGKASVKKGYEWGFIDRQGNTEIPFIYERAGNFKEGMAWVATSEGYGYIDKEGKQLLPPVYDKAFDFENGIARIVTDGKYGLIDRNGSLIQRPKYLKIDAFNRHGSAIALYGNNRVRYGLIDYSGNLITTQSFKNIEQFHEGLAKVKTKNGYGYINTAGRLVINDIYSRANNFSEGRASVSREGKCGYIDKNGKEIIPIGYSRCLDFSDGKAVVYKGLRKAGLIDVNGNYLIEPSVNRLLTFEEGRGLVRDNQYRFYYITEQARLYDGYYDRASAFSNGVAVVQVEGKWGIINQRGIEIIPPKYDKIESFEDGFAKVRIKGFNGLTNLKGELIVQPDYEYISYAGDGLFRVEQGDKVGYFDVDGNWVWGLSE